MGREAERNFKDGVDLYRRAIAAGGLEAPFGERLHGALVEPLVEMPQELHVLDSPVLANDRAEPNHALDSIGNSGSNVLRVDLAHRVWRAHPASACLTPL